jgi:hypothetical protein
MQQNDLYSGVVSTIASTILLSKSFSSIHKELFFHISSFSLALFCSSDFSFRIRISAFLALSLCCKYELKKFALTSFHDHFEAAKNYS